MTVWGMRLPIEKDVSIPTFVNCQEETRACITQE